MDKDPPFASRFWKVTFQLVYFCSYCLTVATHDSSFIPTWSVLWLSDYSVKQYSFTTILQLHILLTAIFTVQVLYFKRFFKKKAMFKKHLIETTRHWNMNNGRWLEKKKQLKEGKGEKTWILSRMEAKSSFPYLSFSHQNRFLVTREICWGFP